MTSTKALVQACQGVYTVTDTAAHFGLGKSTVRRYWQAPHDPSTLPEPPNIYGTTLTAELILADTPVLLARGHTLEGVATILGCSQHRIRETYRRAGRTWTLHHAAGVFAA